jgi:hypothetical protein
LNKDIRIATSLPDNPKTLKLIRRLGDSGFKSLIFLLCRVGTHRPDGNLAGLDTEDIEGLAQWSGEEGALLSALVDIGFIDETEDGLKLHDWERWNPWATGAERRAEIARKAARARWGDPESRKPKPKKRAAKKAKTKEPEEELDTSKPMVLDKLKPDEARPQEEGPYPPQGQGVGLAECPQLDRGQRAYAR